jgi:hypothetical protein
MGINWNICTIKTDENQSGAPGKLLSMMTRPVSQSTAVAAAVAVAECFGDSFEPAEP